MKLELAKTSRILKYLGLSVAITLAAFETYDIWVALTTTDIEVASRCDAALSKELKCWCYQAYGRACPAGAK